MKKVFIYVGHSDWGKSRALKILTGNSSHKKIAQIKRYLVRVRKMSNDDDGSGLLKWVRTFSTQKYDRFVIAFCPKINSPTGSSMTLEEQNALDILIELDKSNELYFFIQEEKYNSSTHIITPQEISWLNTMGTIHILKGQNKDTVRHTEFLRFINTHI